jgi:hypothetical protein
MSDRVTLVMRGLTVRQAKAIAESCYGKLDWNEFNDRALIADPEDEENRCEICSEN